MGSRSPPEMRGASSSLGWALALFGLWVLLVGTGTWLELVAGACAAAIGAAAQQAVAAQRLVRLRPEPRLVARSWRLVYRVPYELCVILAAAFRPRPVRGGFRKVDVNAGSAFRRAFVTVAGMIAPNTIVVDVDRDRGEALVHDLDRRRARPELL